MTESMQEAPCELLDWDSEFFGIRIARVKTSRLTPKSLRAITDWCELNHIECLYFLAESDHKETVWLAEENLFRLVDVRITLQRPVLDIEERPVQIPSNLRIREAGEKDVPALRHIAAENHTQSRFFFDRCFSNDLSQSLFQTWIQVSCQGYADHVMVSLWDGKITGYITCHLPKNESAAKLGLLGISPGFQGRGIGRALINRSLSWFEQNDVTVVNVVTQGRNVPAQRLYQRCGFHTHSVQLWYHRWFAACSQ